jgi:hypothetical protein
MRMFGASRLSVIRGELTFHGILGAAVTRKLQPFALGNLTTDRESQPYAFQFHREKYKTQSFLSIGT